MVDHNLKESTTHRKDAEESQPLFPGGAPPNEDPVPKGGDGFVTQAEATVSLVNSTVGSALLALPHCFRASGAVLGLLILIICASLSYFSLKCLLYCGERSGMKTYEDVAEKAFGRRGKIGVNTCIAVLQIGALIAYVNIISDVLSSTAGTMIPPGAEPSRPVVMAGVTGLVLMPCTLLVTNAQTLASVSTFSIVMVVIFTIAMIHAGMTRFNRTDLEYWVPGGTLISFPVMVFGFANHVAVYPVYSQLRNATMGKMTEVVQASLWCVFAIYTASGLAGYAAFGPRTAGDLLRNLGGTGNSWQEMYERALKLGYGASIVGTVPMVVLPIQEAFIPVFFPPPPLPRGTKPEDAPPHKATVLHMYAITTGVFAVALVSAVLIPNVEFVFGLVGATGSMLLCFILPAMLFLHYQPPVGMPAPGHKLAPEDRIEQRKRWMAGGLLVFGIVSMVLCTGATLTAVKEEADVVQLAQELAEKGAIASTAVLTANQAEETGRRVETAIAAEAVLRGAQKETQIAAAEVNVQASKAAEKEATKSERKTPAHVGESIVQHLKDMSSARESIKGAKETSTALGELKETVGSAKDAVLAAQQAAKSLEGPGLGPAAAAGGAATEGGILGLLEKAVGVAGGGGDVDRKADVVIEKVKNATLHSLSNYTSTTLSAVESLSKALDRAHDVSEKIGGTQPIKVVHHKEQASLQTMEGELSSALQQAINASDTSSALVNKTLENLQEATATSVADLVESVYLSARSKDKPAARDGEGGEGGAAGGDAENPALDVIEGMVKQEVEWATGGATSGAAAKAGEKLEEKFEATIERLESAGGLDKSELLEAAWKEMLQSTSAVVKKDEFNTTAVVEAAVAIAKGNAQGALDEVEALKETAASKSVLSRAEQIAALLQGGSPATAAPAPKATPEATRTEPGAAAAGAEGEGGEASLSSLYQSLSKDDDGNWTLKGVDDTQLAAHLGRRGGTLERDIQVAGQRKAKGSLTLDGLWALLTGRSKTSPGADGGGGGGGDAGIPEGRDLGPRKLDYRDNKAHQHMHDTEGELKKEVSTLDAAKRAVAAAGGGEGSHRVHQVRELGEEAGVEAGGEGAAE